MITVQPIPVLKDNYAWIVQTQEGKRLLVDPGEAAPIKNVLCHHSLDAILLTHHHADHIGGADALRTEYGVPVYGPDNARATIDTPLVGGEVFTIAGIEIRVFSSPGHAVGHITYYLPAIPALFSGDVLFSGGSGRLLEGCAEELFTSIRAYEDLPDETLVCAGHEYTQGNFNFILSLGEPTNAVRERYDEVERLRKKGAPTLPVLLGVERRTNPFLQARDVSEFARLRHLKDHFTG